MKKVLLVLCIVIAFILGKCQLTPNEDKAVNNVDLTQIDTLTKTDYNIVCKAQKDSSVEVRFYEAEITLNKLITDTTIGRPTPTIVRNIIQANDTCWEFTHTTTTPTTIVKYNDFWMEDATINLDSIKVSLDSALILLAKANIVKPNTRKVTLRQPLNPKFKEPLYIFGTSLSVNAVNGKVESFK